MRNQEHSYLAPRDIKPIKGFDAREYEALRKIGIGFKDGATLQSMMDSSILAKIMGYAADSLQPTVTTASIGTPVQFLQNWLSGFVFIITAARKIDELVGITTTGSWEDEEIVQGVMERTGSAQPYGDFTNVPFSSWNVNFERRTNIRFEEGMMVGREEEARAARMRVDTAAMKREAAAVQLEIIRNTVGFFGYNSGLNRTYGFLNDPSLPAYVTVATGASGSTLWANKTMLEICKDIRSAVASLRNQSQDTIDPTSTPMTLAIATVVVDYLSTISDLGVSVWDWLKENYPLIRVVSAPQLNAANGGANVFYLYADRINDSSTDGGRVFLQNVPAKFMLLGVQQLTKGYEEDYSNATAGVMCKRPFAVVRRSGI
jgi:hypothetical protein